MQTFTTTDRHGYSVRFSPFNKRSLVVATSQLYGLAGGGTLYVLEKSDEKDGGGLIETRRLEWSDGLFDVAWCPYAEDIAATASGDGSLQIWLNLISDSASNSGPLTPAACLKEHKNEVYSIDWSEKWNFHTIISASWDGSIKLWDTNRQKSLSTFTGHTDLIYCAKFSPFIANIFASVGTDGYLNLWNCFDFSGKPLMSIEAAHASEILCCDWSHFDKNVLVTGGSDGLVRAWDLRNMRHHVFELYSGDFAVRRIAFSPDAPTVLATANYDFSTRIWDFGQSLDAFEVRDGHSEFVCGLDWNPNQPFELADCGWDAVINVYTPKCLKSP